MTSKSRGDKWYYAPPTSKSGGDESPLSPPPQRRPWGECSGGEMTGVEPSRGNFPGGNIPVTVFSERGRCGEPQPHDAWPHFVVYKYEKVMCSKLWSPPSRMSWIYFTKFNVVECYECTLIFTKFQKKLKKKIEITWRRYARCFQTFCSFIYIM